MQAGDIAGGEGVTLTSRITSLATAAEGVTEASCSKSWYSITVKLHYRPVPKGGGGAVGRCRMAQGDCRHGPLQPRAHAHRCPHEHSTIAQHNNIRQEG